MAEIDDVMLNTSINMNGRNPYVMYCHYKAPDGTVHEFKSRSLWCARYDLPQKGKVPVYVEGLNYKKYVVDVEHAEPEEEKE